jgi:hypothetical protein
MGCARASGEGLKLMESSVHHYGESKEKRQLSVTMAYLKGREILEFQRLIIVSPSPNHE